MGSFTESALRSIRSTIHADPNDATLECYEYAIGCGRREHREHAVHLITFYHILITGADPLMSSSNSTVCGQECHDLKEQDGACALIASVSQTDLLLHAAGYVVSRAETWYAPLYIRYMPWGMGGSRVPVAPA
jgi:hypothetical protein